MPPTRLCSLAIVLGGLLSDLALAEPDVGELLSQARAAEAQGKHDQAIRLASEAIMKAPKDANAYFTRANLHADAREFEQAISDYDKLIELDPTAAPAYYYRGRSRFAAGKIEPSVEDFDKYVKLRPESASRQWERGIALYYAGQFKAGAAQFALYQTYHDNDVENATWRYLCMAPDVGVKKAAAELLPIKNDRRVPMMQIYALYRGELKPGDVMQAVRAGNPTADQLHSRLFYAHLYLGLYHEAAGNDVLARKHIFTAADKHKIGHYMWDVAKVHADLLRAKDKK